MAASSSRYWTLPQGMGCVTGALLRQSTLSDQRLAHMSTIDIREDYLRPHGSHFTITSCLPRGGNNVSAVRTELHNDNGLGSI